MNQQYLLVHSDLQYKLICQFIWEESIHFLEKNRLFNSPTQMLYLTAQPTSYDNGVNYTHLQLI